MLRLMFLWIFWIYHGKNKCWMFELFKTYTCINKWKLRTMPEQWHKTWFWAKSVYNIHVHVPVYIIYSKNLYLSYRSASWSSFSRRVSSMTCNRESQSLIFVSKSSICVNYKTLYKSGVKSITVNLYYESKSI